jgi:hypothetical protein
VTRSEASDILARCHVDRAHDFHRLPSDQVEALLAEADRVKYRRPKNANGSRARYFHARLTRALNHAA